MKANFLLGTLRLTEPARIALKRQPYDLIARHAINEHGRITPAERMQNEQSMKTLGIIISRYKADPTDAHSKDITVVTKETWCETLISVE